MTIGSRTIYIHGQMPRCGTNFLIDVLSKHHHIYREPNRIYEFQHFRELSRLHEYIERLQSSTHMSRLDVGKLREKFGQAWLSYMADYLDDPTNQHILLKEPSVENLEYFFDYFPESRLILVVRDGRNAVASAFRTEFVRPPKVHLMAYRTWKNIFNPPKFKYICRLWERTALKTANLLEVDFKNRKSQVMLVRYEDMVTHDKDETERLLDFCRLKPSSFDWKGLENMPVRGSSFLRDEKGNINFSKGVPKDANFDPLKRWSDWSSKQLRVFKSICHKGMQALGYQID